jgi:hypothetical protein
MVVREPGTDDAVTLGVTDENKSQHITHRITGFSDFVHRPDSK